MCEELALIETSPWADFNRGKVLSPTGLARLLRPFDVYPGPLSSGQARGYRLSQFDEAFSRYLPDETVKASEAQDSHGSVEDFKVSDESPSDTLKNAVSVNKDALAGRFDTSKAGISGDQEIKLDETIFTNPVKPTPLCPGYTEGIL